MLASITALALTAAANAGTIDPLAFQWATIGDPGNAPYTGPNNILVPELGSVSYEYRISRLETTTAQWAEFLNSVKTYDRFLALNMSSVRWGGGLDANDNFVVGPGDAALYPVGGMSWREAAMYVNWLHNDKADERRAIEDGAYDISTFSNVGVHFIDQLTHHPDAKYWIPTLDEQFKAFYFDPNKDGPGAPGYWSYPHSSDEPPVGGPPGTGESTADWVSKDAWATALGAYSDVQSPWGLWDTSGGVTELSEGVVLYNGAPRWRLFNGAYAGRDSHLTEDEIRNFDIVNPGSHYPNQGLRIATRVPEPGAFPIVFLCASSLAQRRRSTAPSCARN
ncbi:MAG: SUMF1/EgtB/PvdO family nonheme iron enzyme [Phycisphaerales bacterium]|nr:SUMF1/EgtB/PvdO family nonheme iron enzyme [Phycisphaerales bacterium]